MAWLFWRCWANNDINVLTHSPLFIQALKGEAPQVHFSVNGTQYNNSYYLADGIYPEWSAFVITASQNEKDKLFAQVQKRILNVHSEYCNLDLILLIVRHVSGKGYVLKKIMQACIILHNMIIEDQR